MSTGPRVPLARARAAAEWLLDQLHLDPADAMVVGSIRRARPEVGDIELIAPMPTGEQIDQLYHRIDDLFARPADSEPLWMDENEKGKIGRMLAGWNYGFRECTCAMRLGKEPKVVLKVTVYRYDPGLGGNRGWIQMIRTGPREFGKIALGRWKASEMGRGGRSDKGYPCQPGGTRIPTPTEEQALALCGLPWIAPEDRDEWVLRARSTPRRFV